VPTNKSPFSVKYKEYFIFQLPQDDGIYWKVNFDRFHQYMRDQLLISAIASSITFVALYMYSVLSYSRKKLNQVVGGRWINQVLILSVTQATVFEGFCVTKSDKCTL
jgi:trans-2-enoyl-CoA reductase